jgi:hypothetical protein
MIGHLALHPRDEWGERSVYPALHGVVRAEQRLVPEAAVAAFAGPG